MVCLTISGLSVRTSTSRAAARRRASAAAGLATARENARSPSASAVASSAPTLWTYGEAVRSGAPYVGSRRKASSRCSCCSCLAGSPAPTGVPAGSLAAGAQDRVMAKGLLGATDRRARHDPPPLGRQGCDETIRLVAPARRLVCPELVPLVNHQPEPAQPHQRAQAARRPAAARLVQELVLAPLVGCDDDRARAEQVLVGKRRPRLHLWKGEVRSSQAVAGEEPRAIESAKAVLVGETCEECVSTSGLEANLG